MGGRGNRVDSIQQAQSLAQVPTSTQCVGQSKHGVNPRRLKPQGFLEDIRRSIALTGPGENTGEGVVIIRHGWFGLNGQSR